MTTTTTTTILYDLPSRGPQPTCWSLNPWKTRLALNFKGIPYETHWVEYPDIAGTAKALGIAPNPEGVPYAIPAISLPDGTHMQDSRKIAAKLEAMQPQPGMGLDAPVLAEVEGIMPRIMLAIAPVMMPRVPRHVLNPRSAKYFEETRAKRFGMPLAEFEKSAKGGEVAWTALREPLEEVGKLLRKEDGPFFLAGGVSYVDFVVAGFWQFCYRGGLDVFDRVMSVDPAFAAHYGACRPWLARDT